MQDPWQAHRFIDAQDRVYETVLAELRKGRKASHWMWFVFPQIQGLGLSEMSRRYAISSLEESISYLAHPVLGARLRECTNLVLATGGRTAYEIFGSPDDQKFHSCITLFAQVAPEDQTFRSALDRYFFGKSDFATLDRIQTILAGNRDG